MRISTPVNVMQTVVRLDAVTQPQVPVPHVSPVGHVALDLGRQCLAMGGSRASRTIYFVTQSLPTHAKRFKLHFEI